MKIKFLLVGFLSIVSFGTTYAYGDCRDTINGCTIEQLVTLGGSAPTTNEDRINAYKMAIEKINLKIKELSTTNMPNGGTTETSKQSCVDLKNNLVLGKSDVETGGEVSALQKYLIDGGYLPVAKPTGYYGSATAKAVVSWQKANGMDFVTTSSGVGQMTRGKMKCVAQVSAPAVQKISWNIQKANATTTPGYEYKADEQAISIDVTFANNVTKRYSLGNSYGCTVSKTLPVQNGKTVLGQLNCYYSLSGSYFLAYTQNGKFIVERGDESAKDGSVTKSKLLEI